MNPPRNKKIVKINAISQALLIKAMQGWQHEIIT